LFGRARVLTLPPATMRARGIMLFLGLFAGGCGSSRASQPPQGQAPAMPVEIATVKAELLRDASEYVAVLRSRRSVQIQPQVGGHVTSIAVTSGDRVEPGTLLLQIDPSQQKAALNSQRATHESNQANLDYWRKQVERVEQLYADGAATPQDLDQARSSLRQAQGTARASDEQARAGTVQLRYYRVTAPIAGTIGDIPVRVGDYVTSDTLLTTLDDNDVLEAYVEIPVEKASTLRLGTPVEILDSADAVLAPSKVTFISPRADANTQMVLVKSQIDNQSGRLRSTQFTRVRVIWSQRQGPVVPVLAVQRRAGQSFIWVVTDGPGGKLSAQPRAVQVGPIQEQKYPVVKGVSAGERVVVSGVQKLRPGAPVTPLPAGAAHAEGN
jgi:RND family efflux transporter MFP subunit